MKCPECGDDEKVIKSGTNATRKGRKQRYQCQRCGRIWVGEILGLYDDVKKEETGQ